MKFKVKRSLTLKTLLPDLNKNFEDKGNQKKLKNVIVNYIASGKSPVEGQKFKKYSDGYAKLKGKSAPVDMTVTAKMLSSLRIKTSKKGSMSLFFNSKIAKFHDILGAGKGKVIRRLLPRKNGERFADKINKVIRSIVTDAVDKAVKKQNNK